MNIYDFWSECQNNINFYFFFTKNIKYCLKSHFLDIELFILKTCAESFWLTALCFFQYLKIYKKSGVWSNSFTINWYYNKSSYRLKLLYISICLILVTNCDILFSCDIFGKNNNLIDIIKLMIIKIDNWLFFDIKKSFTTVRFFNMI